MELTSRQRRLIEELPKPRSVAEAARRAGDSPKIETAGGIQDQPGYEVV